MLVEGNYIYGNGVPGAYGEHNIYCEVDGIAYQPCQCMSISRFSHFAGLVCTPGAKRTAPDETIAGAVGFRHRREKIACDQAVT
jgi:hypothetical protein